MKVTRVVCSGCGKEKRKVEDKDNTSEYKEELITGACEDCRNTPEQKLIMAIFGQYDNPWDRIG